MKTKVIQADAPDMLNVALDLIQQGGLIVFPTDTVYGVAASAFDAAAIERIFIAKDRPADLAIPVLLGSANDLDKVTLNPNPTSLTLAKTFWPGALTLVVEKHPDLPVIISPMPTIGLRIPDHPVAINILQAAGPLAVTSANLSGQANTCTVEEVLAQLDQRVALVIDGGETPGGVPSTVVNTVGDQLEILRQGPISESDLRQAMIR